MNGTGGTVGTGGASGPDAGSSGGEPAVTGGAPGSGGQTFSSGGASQPAGGAGGGAAGSSTVGAAGGGAGIAGRAGSGGAAGATSTGGATPVPACAGPAVKVTQSGTKFTLDNGMVQAVVDTATATLPSLIFNGIETMQSGGYYSWGTNIYTAGPFKGGLSLNPQTSAGGVAEVAMTTTWDGSAGEVPLDLEVRFAMTPCSQGVYEYVVLTHPATYPAFQPGEMRINHYLRWDDPFDWFAVDDVRRGPFLSEADAAGAQVVAGAPKEVLKYSTGPFADRPGWQKYDNTVEWGEGTVYGWSSTSRKIGLWLINPSNEYLPGGPMKTELTVHEGGAGRGTLLNYWGGTHFYGSLEPPAANQRREKVLGPWLIYANATSLTGTAAHDALWTDAKARLAREQATWPYAWENDARYPARASRGQVQGRVMIADPQSGGAPTVAGAWVGLANPPVNGAPNFEHQAWDYQYWVRAAADGGFALSNVRPGTYTLHAFVAGVRGVYIGASNAVVVRAGGTVDLGTVTWPADRKGPAVWDIGRPDRTPREFFRGDQAWRYGTSLLFAKDFPNGVAYVVGKSQPAKDWNYMQPGGTWTVTFDLAAIPAGATAASLVLDSAGSDGATVRASMNGAAVGTASFPYDDASIDRDQPHGVSQTARLNVPLAQLRTGSNTLSLAATGRLMWDFLRLEWVTP